MTRPIITLTTDFGASSPYVGQMKGVILSLAPDATLVDISHSIPAQDVKQGAIVLADSTRCFPPETIHIAVVDPGVGSSRKILCAQIGEQRYIAPDNGLLSGLARIEKPSTMVVLEADEYWSGSVSTTFHGRDIMAPVAAHLAQGLDPAKLGAPKRKMVHLEWSEARTLASKIEGEVISVDSFGNLVTNITEEMLADVPTEGEITVRCDDHETLGIFRAYADQPAMTLIAVVGSSGKLELAIVDDSAKIMLGVAVGEKVKVSW